MTAIPDKVLMVGSMNIDTVPEVFRTVGPLLGRRLRRIPDGEPGPRRMWVTWQVMLLVSNPALVQDPDIPPDAFRLWTWFRLAPGAHEQDLHFGSLGYAHAAKASYADLLAARAAGHVPATVKLQVCLPTPYAVVTVFCAGRDVFAIERAYEAAMLLEVAEICATIPHADLAIQWDVCQEMIAWDRQSTLFTPAGLTDIETELTARLTRLCSAVPADVDVGVHLCYGDPAGKHIVEPRDAAMEVGFANAIAAAVSRPLTWLHMPVPIWWDAEPHFRPLADLHLPAATELYLGCVHPDGTDNMQRRLDLAHRHVHDFGIGSECGIARARTQEVTMRFLRAYAEHSREPPK